MHPTAPLIATLCLLGSFAAQAGQIYTWRDASGQVHFSDTPPPSQGASVYKHTTPAPTKPAETEKVTEGSKPAAPSDPDAAFRQRRKEAAEAQAKADKERQEAEARQKNCESLRSQLVGLRSGQRLARYNSAGEREVMDDATREAEIARAEKALESGCK